MRFQLITHASALATNANPDQSSNLPAADRIVAIKDPGSPTSGLYVGLLDGTSLSVRPWIRTRDLWFPVADAATVTRGSVGTITRIATGDMQGTEMFLQILTNTGTVKNALWRYI